MRILALLAIASTACSTTGALRRDVDELQRREAVHAENERRAQHAQMLEARWGIRSAPPAAPLRPGAHDSRAELGEWDQ